MGLEPDGKGFGKVFGGMALRIPVAQMMHIASTGRAHLITVGIRLTRWPEHLAPGTPVAQAVGRIDGMAGLVTQYAPQPVGIAAFDLFHLMTLKLHQAWMSQIKRHRDTRYAVGREPFFGQPHVRPQADAAPLQLVIDVLQPALQRRARQLQLQIAKAQLQQLLVRQAHPRVTLAGS